MLNFPITLKQAQKYLYNKWAGNPEGRSYDPERCAYEIFPMRGSSYQCTFTPGYGPERLYCKTHSKMVEKEQQRRKQFDGN